MKSLIGVWHVVGGQIYDGETGTRFALRMGSLRYEPDGTFAASCTLVAAASAEAVAGEGDAATPGYPYDYSGRYHADEARGVIEHFILSSSSPDDIGTTACRRYQLTEEFLSVAFPVAESPSGNEGASSHGLISLKRGTP